MAGAEARIEMARDRTPSVLAARLAGISVGVLVGIPLAGGLTGVGPLLYLIPLVGMVAALVLALAQRRRLVIPRVVVVYGGTLSLFIVWMGVSDIWTIPGLTTTDELRLLAGLLAISFASLWALDEQSVDMVVLSVIVTSLLVAGYVFDAYLSVGSLSGYGIISDFYLVIAQAVGVGAVLSLVCSMTLVGKGRAFAVAAAATLIPALALSLARGALLFVVLITILAVGFWNWQRTQAYNSFRRWLHGQFARLALLSTAFGVAGIAIGGAFQVDRTRSRLERLFSGREFTESTRPRMWREAWESINEAPLLGHGLGSSGLMSGTAEQFYPHNWVLQVWVDGGLVGLALCIAAVATPLLYAWKQAGKWGEASLRRSLPVAAAYLFLLLEYSKSSDFYSARLLFVMGSVLIYAARLPDTRSGVGYSS